METAPLDRLNLYTISSITSGSRNIIDVEIDSFFSRVDRSFFSNHADRWGRPAVFSFPENSPNNDQEIANFANHLVSIGLIPERSSAFTVLRIFDTEELFKKMRKTIPNLPNKNKFQLENYRQSLNDTVSNYIGDLEIPLGRFFSLFSTSVISYLILNLTTSSSLGITSEGVYTFFMVLLQILRPFILTVVNVRYWGFQTVDTAIKSIYRVLLRIQSNNTFKKIKNTLPGRVNSDRDYTLTLKNRRSNVWFYRVFKKTYVIIFGMVSLGLINHNKKSIFEALSFLYRHSPNFFNWESLLIQCAYLLSNSRLDVHFFTCTVNQKNMKSLVLIRVYLMLLKI